MASEVFRNLAQGINNFISETPKGNKHFTFPSAPSATTAEAIRTSSQSAAIAKNPSAPSTPISQSRVTSSPISTPKSKSPSSTVSSPSSVYPGEFTPRNSLIEFASKFLSPSPKPLVSPSSIYPGSFTPRASLVAYAKTLLPNTTLSLDTQRPSMIYTGGIPGLPTGPYTSYKSPVHGPDSGPHASYDPNKDYISTDSAQPSSIAVLSVESMEDDVSEGTESSLPSSPVRSTGGSAPLSEASSTIEFQQLDFSQDPGPFSNYDPSTQSSAPSRRSTILTSPVVSPKNYQQTSPTRSAFLSAYASLIINKPPALDTRLSMSQEGGMNSGHHTSYKSPKWGMNSGPHGRWHGFSPKATPKDK